MRSQKTYKFKAGEVCDLDFIYNIQGLIPTECYEQDDISDWTIGGDNDGGETVRFVKNVTIKVILSVTDAGRAGHTKEDK